RDLRELIRSDDFREDLYFRVNTFEIRLPPLRERRADIPDLARTLLARSARRPEEQVASLLTPEAIDALLEYEWPGNVRELRNVMEAAYILSGAGQITTEHLPHHIRNAAGGSPPTLTLTRPSLAATSPSRPSAKTLKEIEME